MKRLTPWTFPIKGEISREDAVWLAEACADRDVVEFGMGGSTIIISAFIGTGSLTSFETEASWMSRTQTNLNHYVRKGAIKKMPRLLKYVDGKVKLSKLLPHNVDVAFVDFKESLRIKACEAAWPVINPGGFLIHHDGREPRNSSRFFDFMKTIVQEMDMYLHCPGRSNLMVIRKRRGERPVHLYEWNAAEEGVSNRTPSMGSGFGNL